MIINYVDILYKKIKKLEEQAERFNDRINNLREENEELREENDILYEELIKKSNDCSRLEAEKQHLINNQMKILEKLRLLNQLSN